MSCRNGDLERALFFKKKWAGAPLLLEVWVCWVPELVWIRSGWEEPAGLKGKKTRYMYVLGTGEMQATLLRNRQPPE